MGHMVRKIRAGSGFILRLPDGNEIQIQISKRKNRGPGCGVLQIAFSAPQSIIIHHNDIHLPEADACPQPPPSTPDPPPSATSTKPREPWLRPLVATPRLGPPVRRRGVEPTSKPSE